MTEKIAVRGLSRLASWIFAVGGALAAAKGMWDVLFGEPEANFYSLKPWQFVTREQWGRFAGFEVAYGLACLGLARAAWVYAKRLPEFIEREKQKDILS